ncbi:thiamine monophosphate kinase [Ameyamaea chiangmaiensis NBRC 103196]|uniref:Thiamine-monophosphate kinase n=1 Tax=Ameyamaea chiangmaiensis TaxID=442969 RepID=A0A850P5I7_9PROT|nr:thiamine-phosphate kinase [Ameyamaea chiangmaiensis]MBS4073648.1 thiamine-phosphate kinase [Ameyamaea chiangmaiensis]NVN39084.1 thiamine-phosphate kinase [Ameyamaea chiangmaiensis]GBQ68937.1 thiamine monophosphate kinase [Ameyamaea chiangmaiensis NBRC 103196]
MTLPAEFSFIGRHFRPLSGPGALDLTDDAAVLTPPAGRSLVVAVDAMVEGLHFLPDDPARTIGRKLLRCNLSDLAAMGAAPLGYLLTVSRPPGGDDAWFAAFAAGLADDQATFGLTLLGGDTTSTTGPLVLSLTILGHVAPGQALLRGGARPGDDVWVTGTIGDGAIGLRVLRDGWPDRDGFFADRYRVPRPRLGLALAGIATAAMDISDGLVQDAGHIARASGVGIDIDADRVPRTDRAPEHLELCLTGGDDYELLLTAPRTQAEALRAACHACDVPVTRIGQCVAGRSDVRVWDKAGRPLLFARPGWTHLPDDV